MLESYFGDVGLVRLLFQRGLAAVYLVAFVSALNQFRPLLGEHGLLPVPRFLSAVPFRVAPSFFYVRYSDRLLATVAWTGIVLSSVALTGLSEMGPVWLSCAVWFVLWGFYLSIVNVGQTFYGFGWESMLLEAGFFASFLGPRAVVPSVLPVIALRWMLFRTEFGAGLIKVRHDKCWRNLTCLYYHHETQPLPGPLSWYFHRLPRVAHRAGVVFSHFVQLLVPFGLFLPQPFASAAGALIIAHQLLLIVSGNYSWLNWLTVVLAVTAFSDSVLSPFLPVAASASMPRSLPYQMTLYAMGALTLALSVKPALNFFRRDQLMNYSYNPLHLVNAYGAFGSVTRERLEVVLEGAADDRQEWKEYGFKAKPGNPMRRPPQIAPYHLRLDWMMWFLPLSSRHAHARWFKQLVSKLLAGDPRIGKLLADNPFADAPPRWIRALLYRYEYTTPSERAASGAWWKRERVAEFLPPSRDTHLSK
jgi:hypothetical protein